MHDSLTTRISREWAPPDGKQELNQFIKEGVKYSKFGDYSNPADQILERNKVCNNAQAYATNYGDRVFHDNRTDLKSIPAEDGKHRFVNETWINREYDVYMAVQKRIDQQMKWCVISDEIARQVMGYTDAKWTEVTGPKGLPGMDPEMAKLNCKISYIKSLPTDSVLQTQALSKLRYICGQRLANIHRTATSREADKDDNTEKVQVKKPDGSDAGIKGGTDGVMYKHQKHKTDQKRKKGNK